MMTVESVMNARRNKVAEGNKSEGKEMCEFALVTSRGACIYAFEGGCEVA
jgi:hypothetical protein